MPTNRKRRSRAQTALGLGKWELDQILNAKLLAVPVERELPEERIRELWRIYGRELMQRHDCRIPLSFYGEPEKQHHYSPITGSATQVGQW